MRVLSLFDGMGCGMIALRELGIEPEVYYASEIDKYAIMQTSRNFPGVIHVGDVRELDISNLGRIDLLIGGSPCTDFSFGGRMAGASTADKQEILSLERYLELRDAGYKFEGESYLFWEYVRILTELRNVNPDILFLLENVEMQKKWENVINGALGIKGIHINSALVSAQNRKRIYWSNIRTGRYGLLGDLHTNIPLPADNGLYLRDILDESVDPKYILSDKMMEWIKRHSEKRNIKANIMSIDKKSHCLTSSALCKGNLTTDYIPVVVDGKNKLRKYTPVECARLQTVPDWYKWYCSDTQIYKMLGNGWTISIIKHIFSFIKIRKMKELDNVIKGRGETKGFTFTLVNKSPYAYMYRSVDDCGGNVVYEVFRRVENKMFDCVSYPSSNGFGDSLYMGKTYRSADLAVRWFNHLTEMGQKKQGISL
jgi:DNA (cytosine-5)-methyltransferase 3A